MARIVDSQYVEGAKVLLMDGGTIDLIRGSPLDGGTAIAVYTVVSKFQALLAKATTGGTRQHIVFVLIPEVPGLPGTWPGLAGIRSGIQEACAASQVPCHFLDLQPIFAGHMDYYLSTDRVNVSAAGAAVTGKKVWKLMQNNCIAQ